MPQNFSDLNKDFVVAITEYLTMCHGTMILEFSICSYIGESVCAFLFINFFIHIIIVCHVMLYTQATV